MKQIVLERSNKTIYREDNKLVKMFHSGTSKADVMNEALNQSRVEETEINVPKVQSVTTIDGCWAIVMDFIEGKTVADMIKENPSDGEKYLDLLVDIQLKIHSQKCSLLTSLRDKMFRKISETDLDPMTKYELQTHLDGMPRHNKVLHGDFRPSNVIISPDNKHYVVDWAHVTRGNASADAAKTYLVYLLSDRKNEGEYYLKSFCKKTGTPKAYVERWLRIVAAEQTLLHNENEKEFLARIINVIEYQ